MSPATVLLADDELPMRRAVTRILEGAGYRVEAVSDGAQAINAVRERSFDAIVSDIAMPGATGLALLRAIRQRDNDVPVLLITGAPSVESAVQAVELRAVRYLVKPFEVDTLVSAVKAALLAHETLKLQRAAMLLVEDVKHRSGPDREERFDAALRSLWMAFQPIVSTRSRGVFGFEALVRTGEPTLARSSDFFALASKLGRLNDLGRAVRRSVASVLERAPQQVIYVNLHASDLMDDELYSPDSPLSRFAKRVVLEITERHLVENSSELEPCLADLRKLGYRIAVDDVGAGSSGPANTVMLRPDVVKLDISLVRGIHTEPVRRTIVGTMANAFRELGLTVVAEGVESAGEAGVLSELGIDGLQGYWICRPGPAFPRFNWRGGNSLKAQVA